MIRWIVFKKPCTFWDKCSINNHKGENRVRFSRLQSLMCPFLVCRDLLCIVFVVIVGYQKLFRYRNGTIIQTKVFTHHLEVMNLLHKSLILPAILSPQILNLKKDESGPESMNSTKTCLSIVNVKRLIACSTFLQVSKNARKRFLWNPPQLNIFNFYRKAHFFHETNLHFFDSYTFPP